MCGVQDEETDFEKEMKDEAETLRHKVTDMERELSVNQEKNLQLAELYTDAIKDLEQVKLEMGKRIEDLEIANRSLRKQVMNKRVAIARKESTRRPPLGSLTNIEDGYLTLLYNGTGR